MRLVGDRYRLGPVIGRGGMAVIHRARDLRTDRDVAVKLLRPEISRDPDLAGRFRREALAATVLRHPNIVACLDTGTDAGQPYLVMDLIDGEDLAVRLRRGGRLAPGYAARIGLDVARGLGVAHVRGIVHRDIKPGNILLAADGRAMIADFGIARLAIDAEAAMPGTTLGSVYYFSPEQARGVTTTPASDVYGLGLVLFEALTGTRTWTGADTDAIALARLGAPAPSPRARVAEVPEALDAVVRRALAPEAEDRFPNGFAMAAALEPIVSRSPTDDQARSRPAVVASDVPPASDVATGPTTAPSGAPSTAAPTAPPLVPPGWSTQAPLGPPLSARPSWPGTGSDGDAGRPRVAPGLGVAALGIAGVVLGALLVAALPGGGVPDASDRSVALATPRPSRTPSPTPAAAAATGGAATGAPAVTSAPTATPEPRTPPPGHVEDLCDAFFGLACGLDAGRYAPSRFTPAFDIKLGSGWSTEQHAGDVVSLARSEGRMVFVSGVREVYPSGRATEPRDQARDLIESFVVTDGLSSTEPAKVKIGGEKGFSVDVATLADGPVLLFRVGDRQYVVQPRRVTRLVAVDVDGRAILFAIEPSDGQDLRAILDTADKAAATIRWR